MSITDKIDAWREEERAIGRAAAAVAELPECGWLVNEDRLIVKCPACGKVTAFPYWYFGENEDTGAVRQLFDAECNECDAAFDVVLHWQVEPVLTAVGAVLARGA